MTTGIERNDEMLDRQGVTEEQLLRPLVVDGALREAEEKETAAMPEATEEEGRDYLEPDIAPPDVATHEVHDTLPEIPAT